MGVIGSLNDEEKVLRRVKERLEMVEFNDLEKDKWVWTGGVLTSIYPAREAYKALMLGVPHVIRLGQELGINRSRQRYLCWYGECFKLG